jgi:2-iminobutanoate/2-iminopropanoate deaminase
VSAAALLFLPAIRGADPVTGAFVDDTHAQAASAFDQLAAQLQPHGLSLRHVVKATFFLRDLAYRDPMHEVWLRYFPDQQPARSSFQISDPDLPPARGAHFVMEAVALAQPEALAVRETLEGPEDGPRHRMEGMITAVRAGAYLFFSAIRGRNPVTRTFSADTREQTRQALDNVQAVLRDRGLSLHDVAKVDVYVNDLAYRAPIDEVWAQYFPDPKPARSVVQVVNASASPRSNPHFVLDVLAHAGT